MSQRLKLPCESHRQWESIVLCLVLFVVGARSLSAWFMLVPSTRLFCLLVIYPGKDQRHTHHETSTELSVYPSKVQLLFKTLCKRTTLHTTFILCSSISKTCFLANVLWLLSYNGRQCTVTSLTCLDLWLRFHTPFGLRFMFDFPSNRNLIVILP